MRDWMFLAGLLCMLPFAIRNRPAAYLLWGWTAILAPNYYLYGFMHDFRFNLTAALIALGGLLFAREKKPDIKLTLPMILIGVFTLHTILSALLGYPDNPFNERLGVQFFKTTLFCLSMALFVGNRTHLHAVALMLALGLGFHGVVEGLKVINSGGVHQVKGLPTTMMSDNNHFGVAMVMVVPLLYYLYQQSARRWVRWSALVGLGLTVTTIFGTQSRGGMVALAAVAMWFLITARRKLVAVALLITAATLVVNFGPESWFDRINSIGDAERDSSFMGRVAAWKISTAIALENPILGGGFHALQVQRVWETFKYSQGLLGFVATPEPDLRAKAAHSIYFEIMGDMGFVGLALFLSILGCAFVARIQIGQMVKTGPPSLIWATDLANALMLSLVAYCIGGAAVSLGYLEIPYMLVMMMEILRQTVARTIRSAQPERGIR